MASPYDEEDDQLPTPAHTARRIGYSSRGNASPVGESVDGPENTLDDSALTLDDGVTQDRQATALRRRYQANQKAAATVAQKTVNAQREAEFRTKGQKFYTDSFGNLQPEVDEQGKPRFAESPWKKTAVPMEDGGTRWALTRRNDQGQTETRAPKLVDSGDVKDPNLYYDFGGLRGEREIAGHVDDLVNSEDTETARTAAAYRAKRNGALRKESLAPLQTAVDQSRAELDNALLRKSDVETRIARLNEQMAAIDQNPAAKQTSGGLLGIGAEPTPEARRLQAQRAALQSQVDELSKQAGELATATDEKTGPLATAHARAKLELDAWSHTSKLGELDDLATQRRVWLRQQGRSEKEDPVLAQILTKQEEYGLKASEIAKYRAQLDEQFQAARAKAAASGAPLDEDQLRSAGQQLEERRKATAAAFNQLAEDAKAGRLDGRTVAAVRQSILDAERDYAKSTGQLAGMADALLKRRAIDNAAARRTMAMGEQLYALDLNDASVLQKIADGGARDPNYSKREALAAQGPAVVEAAKAAAFYAGDMDYADDLYAKLPGKQIAIHPAAFTVEGLKREGSDRALTWRDAIDQAVAAGDLDAKRAEPLRRDLTTREKLAQEAAIDATLDNNVFQRWVAAKHPELAQLQLFRPFDPNAADYTVPASDPALRAAAKEFLQAEPSAAQKIWNGLKMVGVGSIGVYSDGVRAILPDDWSGAKAIKEFADGLSPVAMDPRLDKHWMGLIGQGLGSSLAFATPAGAVGGLARGLGLGEKAVAWTVGGMIAATGAAAQGQQMYDEARQYGASKEVADGAFWLGTILGASEVAPLGDIVRRFGAAKAFSLGAMAKNAVAEIGEEALQEVGQQYGNNAAARLLYDQNRDMFDGLADSAKAAGGSAAIMSLLASVVAGVRYRRTVGVLNAAQQLRQRSEQTLAGTYERPEVQAVANLLPPASIATEQATALRAQLQEAIRTEAAKKNPSEEVLQTLHEQLADVELRSAAAARALAQHATTVAQAMGEAAAAPDFQEIDQASGATFSNPATVGANRAALSALIKTASGVPSSQLTEAETQGLQLIGAQLGTSMVRPAGAHTIVTDKARSWAQQMAPATARVLTQSEGEQLAAADAAAQQQPQQKGARHGQKEEERQTLPVKPTAPAAAAAEAKPTATQGASVTFTNEKGETESATIPVGAAVPSTKAAVRDQASAEQYLAETRRKPVRDVVYRAGAPAPQRPAAPRTESAPSSHVSPAAVLAHLKQPMRTAGAADAAIARRAVDVAKRVNAAVTTYGHLFKGVQVVDQPLGTGGLLYDARADRLLISTADLARDHDTIAGRADRVPQLMREEAIHRAAVQLEKRGQWKAPELWASLAPATRDAFVRAYNRGRAEGQGAKTTDHWAMGHEMVRMLVQGRLAVDSGRLTLDGAAISEETASPALVQRLAEILRKIRDYFTDLAGSLARDGNADTTVAEVRRVVDLITERLRGLEAKGQPAASQKTASQPTVQSQPAVTRTNIAGQKLNDEWTAFSPQSGTLGIPRAEMPQIASEHRGALTQFLTARGITHRQEERLPGNLRPTQAEFSPAKVDKARKFEGENRAILVSSDDYVLDGHHQYVAALTDAPEEPYPVIRFNAPIRQLLEAVHDFPSVRYSRGATSTTEAQPATSSPAQTQVAKQMGIPAAQVGTVETVTHKGRTVQVANVVIEAEAANTSHNADGTTRSGYPQALQPRDRSGGIYLDQQRRIAANPNWSEEMLTGTPDRGTPIMAKVGDQVVTVIGNGRANAKALMYSAPDLAATAAAFKSQLVARAKEKGIDPAAAAQLAHPVFARFLLDPLSPAQLRAFSQESNEFSGAATNAVEQAKVDASRLTPDVLAFFDPTYDLDAAKNDDFRREFVRQVIGRAENITGADLRRRVQAALFAKAFGDTEAGMAAFSRLAGEDDEGVRNLVRAMLDVAPAFAALRQRIAAGTLHPLDLAPTLTRAVQEIAVTLRDKPAKQATDVALDGLVNQGDLALASARTPIDDAVLRFLVAHRRNRAELTQGLSHFVAGVYAAGDPRQEDLFGATAPAAVDVFRVATAEPGDAQSGARAALASQLGRAFDQAENFADLLNLDAEQIAAKYIGPEGMRQIAAHEARLAAQVARLRPQWQAWYARYEQEAPRFARGTVAVAHATNFPAPERFFTRRRPKGIARIVEKALYEKQGTEFTTALRDIKDTLGATFVVRTRAEFERARAALINVFGLNPAALDTKDSVAQPTKLGYRDIKIRPEIKPGVRAEIIFITPEMHAVKKHGAGHTIYEVSRKLESLEFATGEPPPESLLRFKLDVLEPASRRLYEAAWAADSGAYLASQSARDTSLPNSQASENLGGRLPSGPRNNTPGEPSARGAGTTATGTSSNSSSSIATKNRVPGGNSNGAAIAPTTTARLRSAQGSLFDLLPEEVAQTAQSYAAALPPKARRSKAEARTTIAREIPALAGHASAIDDIFAWAQSAAPLTETNPVRSEPSARTADAPESRTTDTAPAGQNGGRAFTERESDDLGPLFGYTGAPGAAPAENQSAGTAGGDVAGTAAVQPDASGNGEPGGSGGSDVAATGGVSGALPGGGNQPGGRTDARRAAEARRLARIARSRALPADQQNHRISESDALAEGGAKTRARNNLAAIKLLKRLQAEQRFATPEEKQTLAKYVGWGALSQVFDKEKGEGIEERLNELDADIATAEEQAKRYSTIDYYRTRLETLNKEREALERWNRQWGEGYRALRELLTPEEWEAARTSTENAHYTAPEVITAMWRALAHLGFEGGRVLEPSGGVGHFFGLMPEEMMRASELFGVELDTISGGIFRALYPDAQIQVTGFERARLPDNTFDVAISNVPFSEIGPVDPLHDKAKLNLHNYFFAKALDKVRPGGVVAFITTAHTLESQPRQRAYLAERGDFIGAVRLPNNAFSANAGTEVTTDIVFMRKRDNVGASPFAQAWLQKTKVGEDTIPAADGGEKTVPISINEYFARHPEMVLGENSMRGSMYAGPSENGQYTVLPTAGNLGEKLATALRRLPAAYTESGESTPAVLATTSTARDGAFSYENGELGIQRNGTWQPLAAANPEFFGEGKIKYRRKAGEFVRLRDAYRAHLAVMANPAAIDADIARGIADLNRLYDQFTGQWGTLENGRHRELKSDPDFYLLKGLEAIETTTDPETGEQTERIVKADVLRKRTIFPALAPTSAANTLDALRISQAWKGHLDLEFMAELRGDEPASVKRELIETGAAFENPRTGQLETREIYLSGRVREKLRQAEESARTNSDYQRNVEALRAVQPPLVPVREITPKLGGGWVPPALLESFLQHAGFGEVKVRYTQIGEFDRWTITPTREAENSRANLSLFASARKSGLELLSYALDQRTPQVFDTDSKAKTRTFNAQETAAAQAALKRLTDAWQDFARGDAEVSVKIDGKLVTAPVAQITADAFNETFNGTVPRAYDGSHLTLPGSAPFLLGPPEEGGMRQHQKDGIWRAVQDGTAFLAHGVGAGKTRELIAIGMEWKRLGLAKKPMLVVHNPTLNQFANETRKIYPGARTLVAGKEDLQKENRRAFAARVASGDWDLVIIAHSSFNLIDDDPTVVQKFVNDQKAEVEEALKARLNEIGAASADDRSAKKDPTVKQLVKMLRALEARLLKATQLKNKDDAVLFQELGVDGLLIDEAHLFKKVPFVSKMGQVAGLDMSSSARASNLLMRLNDVRARANGRNVVLATGTPITNTLAEVWNMIRLTSPETLKEFSVTTFDQFAAAFGKVEESLEMNPAGQWVPRKRFARFVNGTGLAAFIRSVMDVKLNLELGQPQIANGGLTAEITPRTPHLDGYMNHLAGLYEQWQDLDGEEKALYSAIPLVISGVAKAATMDMRLIDPALPEEPQSKVNRAVDNVVRFYHQETERKGVQIVFADQYRQISTDYLDAFAGGKFVPPTAEGEENDEGETAEATEAAAPTDAGGFNLYAEIKRKLVARGIPADEIAIATEFDTDEKRAALFAQANAGRVRVLLGSTFKLGVGVNVQERLFAMHHLDTPWTPADLEQRIGRGWRAGNLYARWGIPIQNLAYGVERTMDAGRYQLIETKSRFVKQAMEGKGGLEFDDPAGGLVDAAAELKAQFTGDPRVMELVTLENQARELEVQRAAHLSRVATFEANLDRQIKAADDARRSVQENTAIVARLRAVEAQGFTAEQLADVTARIALAKEEILADGALQSERARNVWSRIVGEGVTVAVYAKGEIFAASPLDPKEAKQSPVSARVNAVLTVDGNAWADKGITSEGAKGMQVLLERSTARANDHLDFAQRSVALAESLQAEARAEIERPFPLEQELQAKLARAAQIRTELQQTGAEPEKAQLLASGRSNDSYVDNRTKRIGGSRADAETHRTELQFEGVIGRPNENPPRAGTVTSSPEFKRWFGKSQVVDENGNPLIVYHGSPNHFTVFKFSDSNGLFFFTRDPNEAEYFAEQKIDEEEEAGIQVVAAYLRAENLFDGDNPAHIAKVAALTTDPKRAKHRLDGGTFSGVESYAKEIRRAGFDGALVREEEDVSPEFRHFAVFDSRQIKSATSNRGAFDPKNPDILASGRAADPNQLEFEEITADELAAAERVLTAATRADQVSSNLPLADKIAAQFKIPGLSPDDVRQEARIALVRAARDFDSTKGAFAPFAGTVVRNRLRDLFNREVRRVRTQGTSTDVPGETGATILDQTAAPDDARAEAESADTRAILALAMAALPDRLRAILQARAEGSTLDQVAATHGVSRERARQLAENAAKFVRAYLQKKGVRFTGNGTLASGAAATYGEGDESTPSQIAEEVQLLLANYAADGTSTQAKPVSRTARNDQSAIKVSPPRGGRRLDPIAAIEAKMARGAIDRDLAAGMVNNYLDRKDADRRFGPTPTYTGKFTSRLALSPLKSDDEALRVMRAVKAFDASPDSVFAWPAGLEHLREAPLTYLYSSPAEDEAAITDLMRDLARDVPFGSIDAAGEGGRPDLANPAGPDSASRAVVNAIDAARTPAMERETHEQWREEAVALLARDRAGVLRDLLAKARDGLALDNPVQVKAAQLLVNELIQKAVSTKDAQAMRDAQLLAWSYREGGTEQARAFAARRDPFKRPADRYREFLAGAVFTPTPKIRAALKSAWSPAEKERRIASLTKQLADARAAVHELRTTGAVSIPADLQQRITKLTTALGQAQQQKDRVELLNSALAERMKKIEAEFAKMGVTLDDIFAGEAYLRLRGGRIDNNIFDAANYSAIKRRVLGLIKKGWSNDYIARKTGLTSEQVGKFEEEHIATLRARLEKLGDAALDPEKIDLLNLAAAPARLASTEGGLTPEERARRIDEMIRAMGYGRGPQREVRTRRAGPARRRPAPTATPRATTTETSDEPGATPDYPGEATGRTPDDFGNRQLGLGEESDAQPAPDGAPATTGPRGELTNDAADARRGPGAVPDVAGATGRPNPYDFAPDDAAPPVFDVSDPVHVAQAARVIHTIDSTAFDMVTEFWVNSVLSGPLTQAANIIGNTANTVWDFSFKRFGEAALNAMVHDENAPHMGEFRHMMRAMQPAVARAWRNALRTWTAESPMFENDVLNTQLELGADFDKAGPTRAAIPGKTGRIIRIPGRLLMATDDFFKTWIAHVEAAAQAYRIARAEGLRGPALESRMAGLINLPGSPAWLAAAQKAEELTFQSRHDDKPAGRLLKLLNNVREFDAGRGVKPFRFILPFVRTPFNIFAQGFRQSPAGMALLLSRFARAGFYRIRDGKPIAESYPRPEQIQHVVEQLIAWTTAAVLYSAAPGDDDDKDKPIFITGSLPYTGPAENALHQRTGQQAFTLRIGSTMIPFGRIEPLATILGITIDTIAAMKRSRHEKENFDAVGALMAAIGQQAEEKTFLRGIGDLVGALQGARRGERQNYAADFLASFVPNLLRQPLRELDPHIRERSGGFGERLATNIVPQLAQPKIDVYGQPVERPSLAAWRALVPVAIRRTPEVHRVDRLLENWAQAHPDDAWAPLPLTRTLRFNPKEVRQLTGPELREYATRAGQLAAQMLRTAPLNVEHPTAADLARVKKTFATARTITRRQLFGARAQEIDSP